MDTFQQEHIDSTNSSYLSSCFYFLFRQHKPPASTFMSGSTELRRPAMLLCRHLRPVSCAQKTSHAPVQTSATCQLRSNEVHFCRKKYTCYAGGKPCLLQLKIFTCKICVHNCETKPLLLNLSIGSRL